ncbi:MULTISPECIES: DUF2642 domain-containing protein [Paenibacillus]|uniref:DUF2642 domain-containing protein n=1 Tax=Paenibacillus TaxID=44249 RepID=UPI0022B8891A|nr:DUF2642 domain-containing protein [Paenibacillus caseinilyticus]MCZ8518561.1 DUF2642 domain-containing protein [Paenibacillus caseinilyticus]
MPEYVIMRCGYVHLNGLIVVTAYSATSGAPAIALGAPAAAALQSLANSGFEIQDSSADAQGYSYTLYTEDQPSVPPFLEDKIGETITVETDAGTVSGVLQFVGPDVIQVLETTGDILLIPIPSINAVY